jgi:carbohydrate-selective porin OprB
MLRVLSLLAVLLAARDAAAQLTGQWGGARRKAADKGFTVIGAYTAEAMAWVTGEQAVAAAGLAELGLELDLRVVEPRAGVLHVYAYGLHGGGVTESLGDLHGVSNIVGAPEIRLFELWYDQAFGPVDVRVGLQSADQELVLAPTGLLFLDSTFGMIAQASVNLGGPVYPVATVAARVRVRHDAFSFTAAIFDGEQQNSHGIPTALGESALVFVEAAWQDAIKLGAWVHSERTDAVYAIFDRRVTEDVAVFTRVGVAPSGVIEMYADAGVVVGPFGVALGFSAGPSEREVVIEATYAWALRDWWVIQPDVQWVAGAEQNLVVGVRTVVDL